MKRVSSGELVRKFGSYSDSALAEPVIVTKNGRDRLVLIGIEQFNLLQHALDALEDMQSAPRPARAKSSRQSARRRAR